MLGSGVNYLANDEVHDYFPKGGFYGFWHLDQGGQILEQHKNTNLYKVGEHENDKSYK